METPPRKPKWHTVPPPPPSPKIFHFQLRRRTRRKTPKPTSYHHHHHHHNSPVSSLMHSRCLLYRGKLEGLFDQEYNDSFSPMKRGGSMEFLISESNSKVEDWRDNSSGGGGLEEERWRFQAEMLRAECNFLRMERELALKKLENNKVKTKRTLRSALQKLIDVRKKIIEGKNANTVLEEGIEDLVEKLEEFGKSPVNNNEYQIPNTSNFDKKSCILQRRLQKLGGISESKLSMKTSCSIDGESSISDCRTENKFIDNVQEKMDVLCHGMLDRFQEEYRSMRIDSADYSSFSSRQLFQEPIVQEIKCSGHCKSLIRTIVDQVRAETEQWSQMQDMLAKVRGEMEQLQSSRDFWENRARDSDQELQCFKLLVEQWREKALGFENQVQELQLQLSGKQVEREKLVLSYQLKYRKACESENAVDKSVQHKDLPAIPLCKHLARERRLTASGSKENSFADDKGGKRGGSYESGIRISNCPNNIRAVALKRSPLKDVGNTCLLTR